MVVDDEEAAHSRHAPRPDHCAVAFAVSAVWYMLQDRYVVIQAPPAAGPGTPQEQAWRAEYAWRATTLVQERAVLVIAIVAFACLAITAAIPGRSGPGTLGRAAVAATAAAWAFWTLAALLRIGGHWAVDLMSTHANPLPTVVSIDFTVDTLALVVEAAAYVVLAVGVLGCLATLGRAAAPAFAAVSVVAVILLLTLAVTELRGDDVTVWLELAGGAVVLPAWLLLPARRALPQPVPVAPRASSQSRA